VEEEGGGMEGVEEGRRREEAEGGGKLDGQRREE